jgi:putative transposase
MPQQAFPHLRKRFWGQHIWERGYFCNTIGQVTEEMVRPYFENHLDKSFDDTFTLVKNEE